MNLCDFEKLEQQAESGNSDAMYRLGLLYKTGKDFGGLLVPVNTPRSQQLLKAAALLGHPLAMWRVGGLLRAPKLELLLYFLRETNALFTQSISVGLLLAGKLLTFLVCIAGIALFATGVASLPVSLAIIIGALIIAGTLFMVLSPRR